MFTVVTSTRVLRVNARSIQQLTQALYAVGITYQSIHDSGTETYTTGENEEA